MHRSSPARSRSFHNTVCIAAMTPRPTLAESLSACVLMFGPADVARSVGANVASYPSDVDQAELFAAIKACLERHREMGGAVSDEIRCAQRLCTTWFRWHGQRQHAA